MKITTVFHNTLGKGTVINMSGDYIEVSFENRIIKFKYPEAFADGFLYVREKGLEEKIMADAREKAKAQAEERKKAKEIAREEQTKRTQELLKINLADESYEPRFELHVGDTFDTIQEVMNSCFGWDRKGYYRGFYYLNNGLEYGAWFPKLSFVENGQNVAGDKWYGWINVMSDDGNFIYMLNKDDPSRMNMAVDETNERVNYAKHITFVKRPRGKYEYAGVYVKTGVDREKGIVFERIATDISTATLM